MKTLEELAWTTGDLPTILTQVILAEVEEAARARRFGRNLVRINEDLVRTKGRQVVFYRRGTLTAAAVTEASDLSTAGQTISFSANTLSVSKIGVPTLISQEAIDGSNLDLIRDTIREAGIALADKEDLDIVNTLVGKSTLYTETYLSGIFGGTFPHPPVLTVASMNGNTFSSIDYFAGTFGWAGAAAVGSTVTYYSSTRLNKSNAISPSTMDYRDIVSTANVIRGKKWEPDFILIHPTEMNYLLKDSHFVDASQYGGREPLLRGEIGQISGMKVLVSTNMPTGNLLCIASKRAGWLAVKRNIDLKRWDNPRTDSIELYFYMEYGVTVTDEDAVTVTVNFHSDST